MYTFEEKGTIRSPQYVLHIRLCRWLTSIESIRLPEAFVQTHVVRNRGAIKQQLQQDQGPHQGALVTPTKRNGWDPSKLGIPNNGYVWNIICFGIGTKGVQSVIVILKFTRLEFLQPTKIKGNIMMKLQETGQTCVIAMARCLRHVEPKNLQLVQYN